MKRYDYILRGLQKSLLLWMVCSLVCLRAFSQDTTSISFPADTSLQVVAFSDSMLPEKGIGIEIFKIKSDKKYIIPVGGVVRIRCVNHKGSARMKRARLTDVTNDEFTFTPINQKFEKATYTDATLSYIEFTTPLTVLRGIVVNVVIISAIVVVTTFVIIESLLTGSSPYMGNNLAWIPFDDFHKHIRFYHKKGPKWGVRAITVKR